ncbi:MAG: hypothetical protein J6Y56_00485, partial [Fibrobacterales bacterium]|nr:hypothetical protein [Fibrobacterales bacterium]
LAARWRALKGRLRSSELDRSWLAEVSELARAALLLDGADPSLRTEEMANAKIAALEGGADSAAPSEAALRAAWKTVRQELVHSLYGGGLRPVGKNRETLRALRICLGLNDEETIRAQTSRNFPPRSRRPAPSARRCSAKWERRSSGRRT